MQSLDFFTLATIVVAIVVLLKLRSILGQRSEHDNHRDLFEEMRKRKTDETAANSDNVVKLPERDARPSNNKQTNPALDEINDLAKPRTKLNKGLKDILDRDTGFSPKQFIGGADMAYEMIVDAFAKGDRGSLKNLLSKEVYESFNSVIADREDRGETVKSSFIGIDESKIVGAEVEGDDAKVTVRFVSQIVSATFDKEDKIVDGDENEVVRNIDIWTFARSLSSNNPNWNLVATESEE